MGENIYGEPTYIHDKSIYNPRKKPQKSAGFQGLFTDLSAGILSWQRPYHHGANGLTMLANPSYSQTV
ncbi:MAG: hypothetical protein DI551_00510 [Micavibrio aeruginosavorus]|uniref:Uncharacterized protein n=1 Tax=Micavibrio aeruginosavorus TaxID=349221 RepID=A0A2W5N9C7_9BACT|nr:MAG: hypothetical protein DI551_00510 [Micavibrio aeruginosavorus]